MADDTFAPEVRGGTYGTVVVIGGGCYGSWYLRQLSRAARAGAVRWDDLVVVDRDARCAVATGDLLAADRGGLRAARLVVAEWATFLDRWLGAASDDAAAHARDAIVPSPLMPHLLADWLIARARARWPGRSVAVEPLPHPPRTPWERAAPDGTHFVSFAEWTCPINCIEPKKCPVTRGPRDWSLPVTIGDYAREIAGAEQGGGPGAAVFHCTHRAYGVGMIDVAPVLAAEQAMLERGARGAFEMLVATTSHCHGAVNRLVVGPA